MTGRPDPYAHPGAANPRSLILRFADTAFKDPAEDDPTITRHQEVLAEIGHVWWGWWKKGHEDARSDVIRTFRDLLPDWVGLVNRKSQRYYRASCTAIHCGANVMPAPEEGEATPTYYAFESLYGWFRFVRIEEVGIDVWNRTFGDVGMPRGDVTLFWTEQAWPRVQFPKPPTIQRVAAQGDSVLHLTDLHFGAFHGFGGPTRTGELEPPPMIDVVLEGLHQLQLKVGMLVLSGDFITRAADQDLEGFLPAEIDRLCTALGLRRQDVLMIPGNHDIPLEQWDGINYSHEDKFRGFVEHFYGSRFRELETGARFTTPDGRKLTFVGFNSVRLRDQDLEAYGYVGRQRTRPLLEELRKYNQDYSPDELASRGAVNFAVLHHHILPVEPVAKPQSGRPMSITLDAGELIEDFQRSGIHVVLHGHQHYSYVGSTTRAHYDGKSWTGLHGRGLWIIGCGSTGVAADQLADGEKNAFNVYTPTDGGIRVQTLGYTATSPPRLLMDEVLILTEQDPKPRIHDPDEEEFEPPRSGEGDAG